MGTAWPLERRLLDRRDDPLRLPLVPGAVDPPVHPVRLPQLIFSDGVGQAIVSTKMGRWGRSTEQSRMRTTVVPVKVLIDHSVRQDAITAEHGFQFAEGELSGRKYRYLQPATRTRPPRSDWKQAEIETLPRVAELIRWGRMEAFTTHELHGESFRVEKFPSPRYTDIFEGCAFNLLPAPFERSKWGLDLEQFCSKEDVISYCEAFFLTASPERIERFIAGMRANPRFNLSSFEEKCLRRSHIFRAICKGIDRTHYPDALHLWTAEENGIDVFLTHDWKFFNVITRQKVDLHCKVLLPSKLVANFSMNGCRSEE